VTFRETAAQIKAKRIRKAIARMYAKHPGRAMDHVNEKLDQSSRGEERRQNILVAFE